MRWMLAIVFVATTGFVGCSNSETSAPASASAKNPSNNQSNEATDPAAKSAGQFLRAVATGDEQSAWGRLTPLAAEQMSNSGKTFAFMAVESAKFEVTRTMHAAEGEAAVEFRMTVENEGQPESYFLACMMKQVGSDWRVAGIAYDPGDNRPPVVVSYEAADPPAQATNSVHTVETGPNGSATPQTAQNPGSTQIR